MNTILHAGKLLFTLFFVFLFLLISNPVQAEQEIYWVKSSHEAVTVNILTSVKIMAQVAFDANLIRSSVNLIQVDQNGKQIANLGALYDDGTHGDSAAGDNIFMNKFIINETTPKYLYYKVSVAYKGTLKRIMSNAVMISVKTDIGPEQVRSNIVNNLTQGNIAAAKVYFSTGKVSDFDELGNFTPDRLNLLRDWIQNAALIKDTSDYRVYLTNWIDQNGVSQEIKFMMIPNKLGEWKLLW